MTDQLVPFTNLELVFIGCYLLSLIGIGWIGYRARAENSMRDFYLAGSGVGFFVLLLTLYATQYSGNTLFGFSGSTFRIGYAWVMSTHFMTAIVVFYLLLAPRLYRLARRHGFITPGDYVQHRFRSRLLTSVVSLVMIVAIANFLLAQLVAMGRALEGLTTADPAVAFACGVVLLALIMVIYETLGGFRAIAWTDAIQGTILMVGFALLLWMVFQTFGSLGEATERIMERERQAGVEAGESRVLPPTPERSREWLSYILLVGIGAALYPQAIQRVYAARSARVLRRSLTVMVFLPLTTTVVALIVGIMGAAHLSETIVSDTVLTVICREIQEHSLFGRWLVVVLFAGILAATMSTADSVLLSISSMLTKDLYQPLLHPAASDQTLTKLGKIISWVLVGGLVALAITLREETTLIDLLDRKFDLLVQLSPVFFIGLHWRRLQAPAVLAGIGAGLAVALLLPALGYSRLWGFHPGLVGLLPNLTLAVGGSLAYQRWAAARRSPAAAEQPAG